MSSALQPKQPRSSRWTHLGESWMSTYERAQVFEHRHDGTRVLSALERADAPDGSGEAIPQWHISISKQGQRPSDDVVARALQAFDMAGAEEDNHHPGIARHFWMPCDPTRRVACECKATEDTIIEADGYAWTNPKPETGEACRGCEISPLTKQACPIHGELR